MDVQVEISEGVNQWLISFSAAAGLSLPWMMLRPAEGTRGRSSTRSSESESGKSEWPRSIAALARDL